MEEEVIQCPYGCGPLMFVHEQGGYIEVALSRMQKVIEHWRAICSIQGLRWDSPTKSGLISKINMERRDVEAKNG